MAGFQIERDELSGFDSGVLAAMLTQLERLRSEVSNAKVPADAYSLTSAGQIANSGHDENLTAIDTRIATLHAVLASASARVRATVGNYGRSETADTAGARAL